MGMVKLVIAKQCNSPTYSLPVAEGPGPGKAWSYILISFNLQDDSCQVDILYHNILCSSDLCSDKLSYPYSTSKIMATVSIS